MKVFILILIVFLIFFIYISNSYKAVVQINLQDKNLLLNKNNIMLKASSNIGIIFYPGAKVEYTAYLPLLQKLQSAGYNCILAKMPFNLAFFKKNFATEIINKHTEIKKWYIAGHSLGGAMASLYFSQNLDKIEGAILLGAYVYGKIPLEKSLVIYGSQDLILSKNKLKNTPNEILIQGANHAQFGNYGAQKGDGIAKISTENQQNISAQLIDSFIKNN